MPGLRRSALQRSGLSQTGRDSAAQSYSVSLLQAASALYGDDVARTLSGQCPSPKAKSPQTKKNLRE
ncbi:hypothetical protein [Sphingobium sp.]|uniref:hypothetical protein n=1 Tax=Sphingobium sp. TaxID=1912891 RepID=UPI0035C6AF88